VAGLLLCGTQFSKNAWYLVPATPGTIASEPMTFFGTVVHHVEHVHHAATDSADRHA
jgi:hypothetical protein